MITALQSRPEGSDRGFRQKFYPSRLRPRVSRAIMHSKLRRRRTLSHSVSRNMVWYPLKKGEGRCLPYRKR